VGLFGLRRRFAVDLRFEKIREFITDYVHLPVLADLTPCCMLAF
jgi:hypothetical protein